VCFGPADTLWFSCFSAFEAPRGSKTFASQRYPPLGAAECRTATAAAKLAAPSMIHVIRGECGGTNSAKDNRTDAHQRASVFEENR
jgi:hypothetical protein